MSGARGKSGPKPDTRRIAAMKRYGITSRQLALLGGAERLEAMPEIGRKILLAMTKGPKPGQARVRAAAFKAGREVTARLAARRARHGAEMELEAHIQRAIEKHFRQPRENWSALDWPRDATAAKKPPRRAGAERVERMVELAFHERRCA